MKRPGTLLSILCLCLLVQACSVSAQVGRVRIDTSKQKPTEVVIKD